jgi:hypothetical protein
MPVLFSQIFVFSVFSDVPFCITFIMSCCVPIGWLQIVFVDTWMHLLTLDRSSVIVQQCGTFLSHMAAWEVAWTYWDAWFHEWVTRFLLITPIHSLVLKYFWSSPFSYQPFRLLQRNKINIQSVVLLFLCNILWSYVNVVPNSQISDAVAINYSLVQMSRMWEECQQLHYKLIALLKCVILAYHACFYKLRMGGGTVKGNYESLCLSTAMEVYRGSEGKANTSWDLYALVILLLRKRWFSLTSWHHLRSAIKHSKQWSHCLPVTCTA